MSATQDLPLVGGITVHEKPLHLVRLLAIKTYDSWAWGSLRGPASKTDDLEFLARIMVNYVRHNLTMVDQATYDQRFTVLASLVGKREAFRLLGLRVYAEIARVYPELARECERQARKRQGEMRDQ